MRRKVSDWRSQKKAAKRKREFKIAKAQARAEKTARDAGLPPPAVALQPVPADDAPPTRAEMMQQAEILGIKADKRWSDATLMAKISAAMNPI